MNFFGIIVFGFVLVIFLGEIFLSWSWTPLYYQIGIPIFKKKFRYTHFPKNGIDEYSLLTEFKWQVLPSQFFPPPMNFKALNSDEIAFRETHTVLRMFFYPPIMRGIIRINHQQQVIEVTGYVNWVVLWFLVVFLVAMPVVSLNISPPDQALFWIIVSIIMLLLVVCYVIQYIVFSGICDYLVQKCGEAQ
jgi:hypothetical protein